MQINKLILVLSCKDSPGLIARITSFISEFHANICEFSQFVDPSSDRFFMRSVFECTDPFWDQNRFEIGFDSLLKKFDASWTLYPFHARPRTLILASKEAHCLNDLLHRIEHTRFPIEPVGIISNHDALQNIASWHHVPFFHYPITSSEPKQAQEEKISRFVQDEKIELVILARYMQILSPWLTEQITGKAINIHHSFLPSFKGAKPYHQAFERGVKLIGATAHFVSNELDEGPIIEQEVIRVGHTHGPEDLVILGKDIECQVLARSVRYYAERRIFLHQQKTVILH